MKYLGIQIDNKRNYFKTQRDKIIQKKYMNVTNINFNDIRLNSKEYLKKLMIKWNRNIWEDELEMKTSLQIYKKAQYHNKSAAALLANHHIMFGTTSTWHWLEAGHGKGPCDGIGGSVKKMAETAVKRGAVLSDTDTFFEYFRGTRGGKMQFVRVTIEDVQESSDLMQSWKQTPTVGFMSSHSVIRESFTSVKHPAVVLAATVMEYSFQPVMAGPRQKSKPLRFLMPLWTTLLALLQLTSPLSTTVLSLLLLMPYLPPPLSTTALAPLQLRTHLPSLRGQQLWLYSG